METLFLAIHVFVCLLLIFVVLVQGGKGAEMGAAFGGGGSQTLFGGRGAATFLGKMTTVIAVVFMLTSLILAVISGSGGDSGGLDLSTPQATESPLGTELPAASTMDQPADAPAPVAPPSPGQ